MTAVAATKTLILCDCAGSQKIDAARLAATTGLAVSPVHTALCTSQADKAAHLLVSLDKNGDGEESGDEGR